MLGQNFVRRVSLRLRSHMMYQGKPDQRLLQGQRKLALKTNFHGSAVAGVKKFSDTENDYAHEILQRNIANVGVQSVAQRAAAGGTQRVFCGSINWESLSVREILDQFHSVVHVCKRDDLCISDERFDHFVEALVQKIPRFSDDELVELLSLVVGLGPVPGINTRNYRDIWNSADKVCLSRVPDWNTEKLLFMADQWYPLRLAKIGKFVSKAVWKISTKLRKLPKDQLSRAVFYINLTRLPVDNMVDIEINLKTNFFNFEIDDLAILCMGFFKTETPIRSPELIERIYQLTIYHAANVKDISLAAILKTLRYSSRLVNVQSMERLLTAFVPEVPRLSLFCCLHLALLGTDVHVCHQPSLEAIIERFTQNVKQLRLKDMERIAFAITHYNMTIPDEKDSKLLNTIMEELPSRIDEITHYPKCYISLLNFLTMKDIYSEELITAAFDKRFLLMTYGKNIAGAGREVISLDSFLRINLRDRYSGNYFPEKPFKVVAKLTQDYVPNLEYRLTKSDRMLLEIQDCLQKRDKFCHITHLLPHYQRPDIALLWDSATKQFLNVAAYCPEQYSGATLSREYLLKDEADKKNLRLISVVPGSWNCYVRDQNRFTGGFAMKLRQLELIGFETVVIPWYEWPIQFPEKRESYLLEKLNPLLDFG